MTCTLTVTGNPLYPLGSTVDSSTDALVAVRLVRADHTCVSHALGPTCNVLMLFGPLLPTRSYVVPLRVNEWLAMRLAYRPIAAPKYVLPDPPDAGQGWCSKSLT